MPKPVPFNLRSRVPPSECGAVSHRRHSPQPNKPTSPIRRVRAAPARPPVRSGGAEADSRTGPRCMRRHLSRPRLTDSEVVDAAVLMSTEDSSDHVDKVLIIGATTAQCSAPRSEPAKNTCLRVSASGRIEVRHLACPARHRSSVCWRRETAGARDDV
jgi:hypothetical protein